MLRVHPFTLGHLIGAVVVSGAAGMFLPDALSALKMVGVFVLGVAVSSFVCQWKPGTEAAGWKLWLVAVLANPIMLLSIGFMAFDWECLAGLRRGWGCFAAAIAVPVAAGCLLPPLVGLAWRGWKRRMAARRAS